MHLWIRSEHQVLRPPSAVSFISFDEPDGGLYSTILCVERIDLGIDGHLMTGARKPLQLARQCTSCKWFSTVHPLNSICTWSGDLWATGPETHSLDLLHSESKCHIFVVVQQNIICWLSCSIYLYRSACGPVLPGHMHSLCIACPCDLQGYSAKSVFKFV